MVYDIIMNQSFWVMYRKKNLNGFDGNFIKTFVGIDRNYGTTRF